MGSAGSAELSRGAGRWTYRLGAKGRKARGGTTREKQKSRETPWDWPLQSQTCSSDKADFKPTFSGAS